MKMSLQLLAIMLLLGPVSANSESDSSPPDISSSRQERNAKTENAQKPLHSFKGYDLENSRVVFSPDGRLLAAAGISSAMVTVKEKGRLLKLQGQKQSVKVWNTTTRKLVQTLALTFNGSIHDLAFSQDGKTLLVCSERALKFYRTNDWQLIRTITSQHNINSVAFSPDRKQLSVGYNVKEVKLWRTSDWKLLHKLNTTDAVSSTSFSPDSKILAIGTRNGRASLWDTSTGKQIPSILQQQNPGRPNGISVTFSPVSNILAISRWDDENVSLWDTGTGKQIQVLTAGWAEMTPIGKAVGGVDSVAFSPRGKKIVTASIGGMKLWDVATGKMLYVFHGLNSDFSAHSVIISPDGKLVAAASRKPSIDLWEMPFQSDQEAPTF